MDKKEIGEIIAAIILVAVVIWFGLNTTSIKFEEKHRAGTFETSSHGY